jgi:hypothetical protein
MSDKPSFPLVWIEWNDAATIDPWTPIDDLDVEPQRCVSVGFLVRESAEAVCVSVSVGGDDACGSIVIPKGCITRREPMLSPIFVAIDQRLEEMRHG